MRLILSTHVNSEYFDGCRCATLDLTPELATYLLDRFADFEAGHERDSSLTEMHYFDASAIFLDIAPDVLQDMDVDPDFLEAELPENFIEDYGARTECDRLVVCSQEVYWNCYPKHCDFQVETRPIPIDIIKRAAEVAHA